VSPRASNTRSPVFDRPVVLTVQTAPVSFATVSGLTPTVTLAQLSYFVAVAEELHFGRAATRLHIAQPPLSQAIRTLETNLGVTLFERTSRHVGLTEAGAQLLPAARQALAAVDHAVNIAQSAAAAQTGVVRVGFLAFGACDVIDRAIGAFADQDAALRVQTRQADFTDPSAGLDDGHVDAAFVRLPITSTGLEIELLNSEPRVAVLAGSHPLATRDSVTIAELLSERWLQMPASDPAWRDFWLAHEYRHGAQPLLGPEVRTVEEQLAATTAGGYVSLTARSVAAYYPRPGISYVAVEDISPSQVAIAWRQDDDCQALQAFLAAVRTVAASIRDTATSLTDTA
jgi:DNA-binding transcriptional LysR family regulator